MKRPLPLTLFSAAAILVLSSPVHTETTAAAAQPNRDQIIHVLNRVTFGIRPGDIETVEKMGLRNYLERQLHPETINDSAVDREVAQFAILKLSQSDLNALFRERKMDRNEAKNDRTQEAKTQAPASASPAPESALPPGKDRSDAKLEIRRGVLQADTPGDLVNMYGDYHTAVAELTRAKLIRAIDSERQLQEVLVDFWNNHFNVDMKKGLCCVYKVSDDRDAIRPHIFGKFHDLLEASAKSPAMLTYLDNAKSTAPRTVRPRRHEAEPTTATAAEPAMMDAQGQPAPLKKGGINENYAREIMELHTLGVDGGYTQKDVQEVARCFTGWSIDYSTGKFAFYAFTHDNGTKVVLGHTIPANGGIKDGEMVLDILCAQPACAHFISKELCQRFVGDKPPEKLVNRVAAVFTQTDGNLRAVTEAILTSPEFLDPSTYGNKIKSPFEYAVSAVRASGSKYADTNRERARNRDRESAALMSRGNSADRLVASSSQLPLSWHVFTLGEPLFVCTPPTGYKETSSAWVNPGALIERLNFALDLTEQRVSDIQFSARNILGQTDLDNPHRVLDQCIDSLLHGEVSPETKHVLTEVALPKNNSGETVNPNKLIALIIGSPEFQRK